MNTAQILAKLAAIIAERRDVDAADVAQDALTRALEADRTLRGDALFAKASEQLALLQRQARWDRKKGHAVPTSGKARGKIFEPIRRQQSAKRRLPKGVVSANSFDSGFNLLSVDEGDSAGESLRFAAAHLVAVDLPRLIHGEPYPAAFGELVISAYRQVYNVAPQFHWAHVLIEEVERAKLQSLRSQHPDSRSPTSSKSEVTLTRKRPSTTEPRNIITDVEAVMVETVPGRAVRHLFAMIDGKRTLVGTELLTQDPDVAYPQDPRARSMMLLDVVRRRLASLAVPQNLPAYADNPVLVGWLFARSGFAGGGGQEKVKRETLLVWLTDPVELVSQVQRYRRRRSQRGTAAEARMLKAELATLAGEIRRRSSG